MAVSNGALDNWFTYHRPTGDQPERYEKIRAAAMEFARVIVDQTPSGTDQAVAIRAVRAAVFWANAAIACGAD
jgi:hypothetical protein